ncbi:glutamine amidotransferase-like class 1 domain-containing protein 1 isoform X1 [Loxodonta africana]|uniref:glutamine amidotransferase-like class 1 domain-containing protein 1 isoform X1 n=2 Tax=Loxodonta africana TaxID=9785 RepID=UPI0030CE5A12
MASERLPSRPACLLVASGAAEGVSAPSFLHCFTLASAAFNLQVATPGGKAMDFVDVDESNARWVQDFRLRSYASPAKLESIDGARYHALLIPSCPGALADLASSGSLARILQHFHSESKPICAVGHGVAALCCATSEDGSWEFQGYSVTGPASQTQCTWCWTATLSPARTPAPLCQLCKTCFSSVAAGNEVDCTKQPALLAQMSTEEVGLLHRLLLGLLRPHLRAESSRGL